jgi:NAD-dependent dihydropyrimidine dehydrogenase PreA subunit
MHNGLTQALFEMFPQEEKGDFYHAYIYLKHLEHFMYHALQVAGAPAKRPESQISDDVDEMLEAAIQTVAEGAVSRDTSTYHGKVVKLKDALQLVTQKKNITLKPAETVIPYKQARDIILQNPESISVGECPCRAAAETSCLPPGQMDVCLFVGDPHASFIGAYNPKFRKITQDEAAGILQDAHAKGFVHCAYFKKDVGRRFVAICNCCSCCCQGMKAWNMFQGAIPVLAASGYLSEIADECNGCAICVDACGFHAISMADDGAIAVVDEAKCMGCAVCEDSCPLDAISLRLEPSKGEPLDLQELLMAETGHVHRASAVDKGDTPGAARHESG